jgi:HAMP domain-containing protein
MSEKMPTAWRWSQINFMFDSGIALRAWLWVLGALRESAGLAATAVNPVVVKTMAIVDQV